MASVVEFVYQVKGAVVVRLLDVLRILVPLWGLAGVVMMIVFLAVGPSAVKVRQEGARNYTLSSADLQLSRWVSW